MSSQHDNGAGSLAGCRGWIICDDKMGNQVQGRGVADALGLDYELKIVAPRGLHRILAPWGGVARAERFGMSEAQFSPPWPAVAIAVGRASIPYIKALGRHAGPACYRIILLDPKTGPDSADVIWVPQHDRRRGPNVITTITAPHSFTAARIEAIRSALASNIQALPHPRVALLLGGRTKVYRYGDDDHGRLAAALAAMARLGASFMITPSRRTHKELLEAALSATEGAPRLVYEGRGSNPYGDYLCGADHIVVSADSVNMCGEAAATGRPVHVFEPAGGSAKFNRFHKALRAHGAARPLTAAINELAQWHYQPLHAGEDIARQIEARWSRRRAMIPGLTGAVGD